MDYKELLRPYSENGRTPEGQRLWLNKKGIPPATIEQAMIFVYDEMDRGKKFDNGTELDHYLFAKAQEIMVAEAKIQISALEEFHQTLREKWGDDLQKMASVKVKPGLWKRVKAVFKP